MDDTAFQMMELYSKGLNCSQILMSLGLSEMGQTNPDLIKAIGGLGGGVGFSGKTCGALTGGACLLSLRANRDKPADARDDLESLFMITELVEWFESEIGQAYGSTDCADIIGEQLASQTAPPTCASIVSETYKKVIEISGE